MIKKLGHYSLTNPASVYDEEALTALELVGRTAQKVNECIDDVNENTELVADIPNKVKTATDKKVEEYLNDGTFDKAINAYAGDLETRLDNIIDNTVVGGTTMDAEVIDARVGNDSRTYNTLGKAIRGELDRKCYGYIFINAQPIGEYGNSTTGGAGDFVSVSFPQKSHIFYDGNSYTIENASARLEDHRDLQLFNIIFNYKTLTLSLAHHGNTLPSDSCIIGHMCFDRVYLNSAGHSRDIPYTGNETYDSPYVYADKPVKFTYTTNTVTNERTFTIDTGKMFMVLGAKSHWINARNITLTVVNSDIYRLIYHPSKDDMKLIYHASIAPAGYISIGILNCVTARVYLNGNVNDFERHINLTPVILGWDNPYLDFDSVNKTVTIPRDSLLMCNSRAYPNDRYTQFVSETPITVSFAEFTTTSLILYYDDNSKEVGIKKYNDPVYINEYVIATFRTNGTVSAYCPWYWDGKPYNIELAEASSSNAVSYNPNLKIICHRGYTQDGKTENTLGAYRRAWEKGYKYVECDVRYTFDRVPVLLHDETVDRTSNGTGKIAEMTFEQVRALDFGGEQIPTFEEFIKLCKMLGLHAYIELKDDCEGTVNGEYGDVVNTVFSYGMEDNVTWISFLENPLGAVAYQYNLGSKDMTGAVNTCAFRMLYLTGDENVSLNDIKTKLDDYASQFVDTFNYVNQHNIVIGASVSPSLVNKFVSDVNWKYSHIHLETWTVNDESTMKEVAPYVRGITTDKLRAGGIIDEWS